MRIARWETGEGFVDGDDVLPFAGGPAVADVLAAGLDALPELWDRSRTGPRTPLSEVRLLAPLRPASVRDFVAFEEHVEGVTAAVDGASQVVPEWYEAPTFYFTNPHTVVGTGARVDPPVCERLDLECELAVVIGAAPGSDGANLTRERAARHVFGYTVMNDWSARDLQSREMKVRLGPCKGKDFATTLGPWIVTADELEVHLDADGFLAVTAEVRVNDELVGTDVVANMGWTFPDLVAYAARNSRVVPGDVLGSGTVGNGGCLAELWGRRGALDPAPLREGDEVRVRVEGVGEVVNVVGPPVPAPPVPPARRRTYVDFRLK